MTRDMTSREFAAALARNNFKQVAVWIMDQRPGAGMKGYGLIYVRRKVHYRETLAHALRSRERDDAKAAEAARAKARARVDLAATLGIDAVTGALLHPHLGRLA